MVVWSIQMMMTMLVQTATRKVCYYNILYDTMTHLLAIICDAPSAQYNTCNAEEFSNQCTVEIDLSGTSNEVCTVKTKSVIVASYFDFIFISKASIHLLLDFYF